MKIINKILIMSSMLANGMLMSGHVLAQDSAVYDASQGAWRLQYTDPENNQWTSKLYIQQNAIEPRVQSSVLWNGSAFSYQYRVTNLRKAKQTINLFRVWGIPLIYEIPNFPQRTADYKTDNENWQQQGWAQTIAKGEFENKTVKAPKGWSAGLRIDKDVNQTSFVWTPGLKDSDPDGIAPGRSQGGFIAIRSELPGVTTAKLEGSTEEPWGLDNLPNTPYWEQKKDEIWALDYLTVPVLAPIIVVPTPYNGAELARRIKTHMATWLKIGLITQDTLDRLNRHFDALIAAQKNNNKVGTHAAVAAILQEAYSHHRGLNNRKNEEDDDEHDAVPVNRKTPAAAPLHRVAARALSFDLMYLLTRANLGR